jgi:hypothetical protein
LSQWFVQRPKREDKPPCLAFFTFFILSCSVVTFRKFASFCFPTGVACRNGSCNGLNEKTNLRVVGFVLLDELLKRAPRADESSVEGMLRRVRHLNITPTELVNYLIPLAQKYGETSSIFLSIIFIQATKTY